MNKENDGGYIMPLKKAMEMKSVINKHWILWLKKYRYIK